MRTPSAPRKVVAWSGKHKSSTICPDALLNDDIVYLILTVTAAMAGSERQRREELFRYSLVCQVWGRAAQSLLFRHVFLQIRPAMLSLLKVVSHDTERGRRLAGYIKSAEVRLSRALEPYDPPSLTMIHPRHLPALLCHMPNLRELDLTTGSEALSTELLSSLSRGPQIRVLTLRDRKETVGHPVLGILNREVNPWPYLESINIKHPDRILVDDYSDNSKSPKVAFSQVTVEYLSAGGFEEVAWLTQHSRETLTHLTVLSGYVTVQSLAGTFDTAWDFLSRPSLKNVRSLSVGHITWTDDFLKTLHMFNRLTELRFLSAVLLMRDFPTNLPDTIEHLVVNQLFCRPGGLLPEPVLEFTKPALLSTCNVVMLSVLPSWRLGNIYVWIDADDWAHQYVDRCLHDHIPTELSTVSGQTYYPNGSRLGSSRTPIPSEVFTPTSAQLDTSDFDVIKGRYESGLKYTPPPIQRRTRDSFSIMRDLLSSLQARLD